VTTLRIAWRNLGRNRKRTLLAMGAIALAQTTLLFVNGLTAGSYDQMLETITGPMIGHVQVHHPEWRKERAIDLYIGNLREARKEIAALSEVTSVSPRLYSAVLAASGEKEAEPAEAEPAMIVGVDVSSETMKDGLLETLSEDEQPKGNRVAVGRVLANRMSLRKGQLLAVIGQDVDGFPASDLFTVGAIIESSVDLVKTRGIVMAFDRAAEFMAMPDQAHEIIVRGTDFERAGDLARKVAALPALSATEVLSWREAVPEMARMIDMKTWYDLIFLGVVFIAAAAGIANTAMMSTFERTHEFGMLLAIGSRPARVVRMVLIEAVLLGLIGVTIGSAIGSGLVLLTGHTGLNYAALSGLNANDVSFGGVSISFIIYPRFEARHILFGFIAVTLTSALASLWPAWLAARLEPVKAMRQ
jgi:ABC-type lipoprotein release transport system permease subunit